MARGAAAGATVLVGGGSDALFDDPAGRVVVLLLPPPPPPPMPEDEEPVVITVGMGTGGTLSDKVGPPETMGGSMMVGIETGGMETGGMETGGKTVLPLASVGSTGKVTIMVPSSLDDGPRIGVPTGTVTRPVSRPTVVVGSRVTTSPAEFVIV